MSDAEKETNKSSQVYELGYLLVPTLAPEDVPAVYGNLKELIILTSQGEIISDEIPKNITLTYPMQKVISNVRSKFTTAYFGWIKFTMSREQILELKKRLDLDPNLIRFLILKTVKENTIATKRFMRGDVIHRRPLIKRTENEETMVPINKEEIDKEIDALVAM
ncbi:hypothetical protein A2814_02380 [Candidatus Nomurabacteria bacterium RIFCSPHIGHO2_01_FULL_38_19]|uniref:Small ribosomal subunit protein bS6 n=1 Tax=Candidatus Nomurabacteria bacterium RIFCSPHIGHO2_01_FULL_38_19 TaxID=1801732 RepID=A0A1F6UR27_9BACT|nr:MAG: hypothetical protein A2814_02380 [Candidatus Nomurabacteria bacterium RIFCSPHIGHO2_01_FULL_38_19]